MQEFGRKMWAWIIFSLGRHWVCRDQDPGREMCCPVTAWAGRVPTHPFGFPWQHHLSLEWKSKAAARREGHCSEEPLLIFAFPRKRGDGDWRQTKLLCQSRTSPSKPALSPGGCKQQRTQMFDPSGHLEKTFPFISPLWLLITQGSIHHNGRFTKPGKISNIGR